MSTRDHKLTQAEISQAFSDDSPSALPAILTTPEVATLLRVSRKTIDHWKACGYLEGTYRKRGKHVLYFRDRVVDVIFNGPNWRK